MPNFDYENKFWGINKIVAGVDEVGRGCLAGPVVSASVILNPLSKDLDFINEINDSKKLSGTKREKIYSDIISSFDYSYSFIDNEVIDEINILNASILSMKNSVDNLKIKPDHILVDGNRFSKYDIDYTLIVKGDERSFSIAAASILAKVLRDRYMLEVLDKQYPEYGFAKHKGYATSYHIEKIREYGVTPIHRKSFMKKILSNQQRIF